MPESRAPAPVIHHETRPDGTDYWWARVDTSLPGQKRYAARIRKPTRRELESELAKIRAARDRGEPVRDRSTVAELIDAYLAHVAGGREPASRVSVANALGFPREYLGGRLARTIGREDIQAMVAAAAAPGRVRRRDRASHAARAQLADRVRATDRPVRAIDLARDDAGSYTFVSQGLAQLARAGVITKAGFGVYIRNDGDDGAAPTDPDRCGWGQRRAGYAPSGVRTMLSYTRATFVLAVADRKLPANPCDLVKGPRDESRPADADTWTAGQLAAFLAVADTHRLAAGWRLSACGLRRGEVLGLRWADVDLAAPTITVAQSRVRIPGTGGASRVKGPKSDLGARVLPIDPLLAAALAARLHAERAEAAAAGRAWEGPPPGAGLVIRDELGGDLDPGTYSAQMGKIRDRAGLPKLRGQNPLRHTANTLMAGAGIPVEIRAQWCGHTEAVNAGVYTHGRPEDLAEAAAVLARLMTPDGPAQPGPVPADQLAPRRAVRSATTTRGLPRRRQAQRRR